MRRPAEEPDQNEQANIIDPPQGDAEVEATVERPRADHPLLGLGLAIETYHRGVT